MKVSVGDIKSLDVKAVYVDDELIEWAIMADDENGIVVSYALNEKGSPMADNEGNLIKVEHKGKVKIEMI